MTGAIHRPQRSTLRVCSTTPMMPSRVNNPFSGARLRCRSELSRTMLTLKSGAASDQLITPESASL